jgi:hypothetical protein
MNKKGLYEFKFYEIIFYNGFVMKYSIRPFIYNTEEKYTTFLSEIHNLSIAELNHVIEDFYAVMNGMHDELSWKSGIADLDIRKEVTHLSCRNVFMAEIPTVELYNMLIVYRDKWLEYEK